MGFLERLQHGWNAFMNKDPTPMAPYNYGPTNYTRPDRPRFSRGNDRTIITPVLNRISTDGAAIDIEHVKLDDSDRFLEDIKSPLHYCLTTEANIDQTARAFKQDIIMSLLDEGCIAVVPTDTDEDIFKANGSISIYTMRTAKIIAWYPKYIRVKIYNENTGQYVEMEVPKKTVAIIENPFYAVMNEQNSTLKRLLRKLNILDAIDEQSGSGKLDLIIQLPYSIKTKTKQDQAEARKQAIEDQLRDSKFGIAYIDSTEKITQLNRSVENNLMKQIEYLTNLFFSQLSITQSILDGTADENTMNNYYNRTIEPIMAAIVDEFNRKFLSRTARDTQHEAIKFFQDPFKLVSTTNLAELADKFTRNEIMTSNEFRQIVGLRPSNDPRADELRNKNLSASKTEIEERNKTGKQKDDEKE